MTDFLQAHPDGQVIALDEMSLYFQATTTRVWSLVGQTPLVRVSPQRDHIHFCGAVNLRTGHEFALPTSEMSGQTTAAFLLDLLLCYPIQPILLLWDRAKWHNGEAVRRVFADHPRLDAVFFRLPVPISTRRSMFGRKHEPMSATITPIRPFRNSNRHSSTFYHRITFPLIGCTNMSLRYCLNSKSEIHQLRQRYTVCSATPYFRQTSVTLIPLSTSFRMRMICSSL